MTSTVIPISMTTLNVGSLASYSESLLDRNVVRLVDDLGISTKTPQGQLKILESWINEPEWENKVLKHFSFGVSVFNDDERVIFDIRRFLLMPSLISKENKGIILTDTLENWIIHLRSSPRSLKSDKFNLTEIREVLNAVHSYLEQAGFHSLFSDLEKQSLRDGTYIFKAKDSK